MSPPLTFEAYKHAIETSFNRRQACIKLNIVPYGANYVKLNELINDHGLKFYERTQQEISDINQQRLDAYRKRKNKYSTIEEARIAVRKVKNKPTKDELLSLIWTQPVLTISKNLKVSDVAIRGWIKRYNIPNPPAGYWRKYSVGKIIECNQIKDTLFKQFQITN